jgi:hypothetical protein
MKDAADRIRRELERWPRVVAAPHRFGGLEFRVDRRELGHLHGDRLADLPFPIAVRDTLVTAGRAQRHHVLPDSGWISRDIRSEADVDDVIALFRMSYDRPWRSGEPHDLVDEASEDSFPASDPPAFVPVTGVAGIGDLSPAPDGDRQPNEEAPPPPEVRRRR